MDTFEKVSKRFGLDVVMKKENEISDNDMLDWDICISVGIVPCISYFNQMVIGGDSTYLRAAGLIENNN